MIMTCDKKGVEQHACVQCHSTKILLLLIVNGGQKFIGKMRANQQQNSHVYKIWLHYCQF